MYCLMLLLLSFPTDKECDFESIFGRFDGSRRFFLKKMKKKKRKKNGKQKAMLTLTHYKENTSAPNFLYLFRSDFILFDLDRIKREKERKK